MNRSDEKTKKYKASQYNTTVPLDNGSWAMYNSFSGALSILDGDEKSVFSEICEENTGIESNMAFLDRAMLNNYIVPADVDECALLEEKYIQMRNDGTRLTMTILPTLGCNFRCDYCFQGTNEKKDMPTEVQDRLYEFIKQSLSGKRALSVTWFGGEPTLAMRVIRRLSDKLIAFCDKNRIAYSASIITNGYSLSPECVGELYVRRVRTIQITLDGPSHVHDKIRFPAGKDTGSFEKIIGNVKRYQHEYPVHTSMRANIDAKNSGQCEELIDELDSLFGSKDNISLYFSPIHASTEACGHIAGHVLDGSQFSRLETGWIKKARKIGLTGVGLPPRFMGLCGAAKKNGYVALPNGDLHKCWETVAMPAYRIGSVLADSPVEAIRESEWSDWSPFDESECRDCVILPNCLGFCAYHFVYRENYSGNSAKSMCPSLKHEISQRLLLYIENIETNDKQLNSANK